MQFSISIVEDTVSDSDYLQQILNSWSNASNHPINLSVYRSSEQMLGNDHWKSSKLIFIDIKLPQTNGIELAHQLKSQGCHANIVILTAFREYVFEGYSISALDYIVKPADPAKIYHILDKTFNDFLGSYFIQQTPDGYLQVRFSEICYFSSQGHKINIITMKQTYSYTNKTSAFHLLPDRLPDNFRRCHRTIIVNINHILQLSGYEITLSNHAKIPVSRSYLSSIRSAFIDKFTF